MISNVDKLLLTSAQQAEIEQMKQRYIAAEKAGDVEAMNAAHQRAEEIRATAGYSGGEGGDQYILLQSAQGSGYDAYEKLMQNYLGSSMNAISAGYAERMAALEEQEEEITAREEQDQTAARSAVWNVQRLAGDGLLTRGLSNTGLADVITATALNQASANAYQALLDRRSALQENETAKAEAYADAVNAAAEVQTEFSGMLGDAYASFYENDADREWTALLQSLENQFESQQTEQELSQQLTLQNLKNQATAEQAEKDYFYQLALQKLKRQWELEDQEKGL